MTRLLLVGIVTEIYVDADKEQEGCLKKRRCRTLIADERKLKKRMKRKVLLYQRMGPTRREGRGLVSVQEPSTDFIEIAKYRYAVMARTEKRFP